MFHEKKFSDLHKDVICGDVVMAESNTTPKFLIVADGDISVVLTHRVVPERRDIRCGGEAIKNSVLQSLSLSLFSVIQFRISATQRDILKITHAASPVKFGSKV